MQDTKGTKAFDERAFSKTLLGLVPNLPPAAACALAGSAEFRHFANGDVISNEGRPTDGILLLISGTVLISISKQRHGATKHVSLGKVPAPAVFGLAETMVVQPSAVAVSAFTPTQMVFVSATQFLRVLRQFPQAALAISQLIATQLAHTYSYLGRLRSNPHLEQRGTEQHGTARTVRMSP